MITFITADYKTVYIRVPGKVSNNKRQSQLEVTEDADDQGNMA